MFILCLFRVCICLEIVRGAGVISKYSLWLLIKTNLLILNKLFIRISATNNQNEESHKGVHLERDGKERGSRWWHNQVSGRIKVAAVAMVLKQKDWRTRSNELVVSGTGGIGLELKWEWGLDVIPLFHGENRCPISSFHRHVRDRDSWSQDPNVAWIHKTDGVSASELKDLSFRD